MSHVHVYEHLIVALKVQLLEQHGRLSVVKDLLDYQIPQI
jgi:hypothetical protein